MPAGRGVREPPGCVSARLVCRSAAMGVRSYKLALSDGAINRIRTYPTRVDSGVRPPACIVVLAGAASTPRLIEVRPWAAWCMAVLGKRAS